MQSKSVNNVCKLLQLHGDFHKHHTEASPLDDTGDLCPTGPLCSQMKIPAVAIDDR